jgi:hypothetical protein
MAQVSALATNDKSRELASDLQVKGFKFGLRGTQGEMRR